MVTFAQQVYGLLRRSERGGTPTPHTGHVNRWRPMRCLPALALACLCNAAFAQSSYPNKPIRLIVGFAPGGAADIIARTVGEHLGRALGQALIIENRPGAGSSMAAELVAKSTPDGYMILIASQSGMIVNPVINKNVGYNTDKDFAPIIQVSSSPLVAAVHPSLPVRTIAELIGEAKRAPGKLNFSTSGNGSMPHLALMLFGALAGVDMVHVPYKSGGLSVQSVLAGDTQVTFATAPSVMPLVQAGRLRGLAVTTRARSPLVPGLPGMEEAGLPNYDVSIWYGFFAPAGTSSDVIRRLFDATALVLKKSEVKQALARDGTEAPGSRSPEDFAAFVRGEAKLMARLIRESGAKID
jgi:tripartite-type tricarboxylate transporter receptor subunit TctC